VSNIIGVPTVSFAVFSTTIASPELQIVHRIRLVELYVRPNRCNNSLMFYCHPTLNDWGDLQDSGSSLSPIALGVIARSVTDLRLVTMAGLIWLHAWRKRDLQNREDAVGDLQKEYDEEQRGKSKSRGRRTEQPTELSSSTTARTKGNRISSLNVTLTTWN
jgi:hypothetical protein